MIPTQYNCTRPLQVDTAPDYLPGVRSITNQITKDRQVSGGLTASMGETRLQCQTIGMKVGKQR